MSVRAWVTGGVGAMVVGAMAGCSSSTADPPSSSTASSSTSSVTSSSTSTTSSSSSSTTPDPVATAEDTVRQLYKEMDAVGQGKGDLNLVRQWGRLDGSGNDTRTKWSKFLARQHYDKVLQKGDTVLTQVSGEPTKKPEADVPIDEAFEIIACVDRSGLTYVDPKGKPVDYTSGALAKSWVSHLVTETDGKFFVARDDPGKSC